MVVLLAERAELNQAGFSEMPAPPEFNRRTVLANQRTELAELGSMSTSEQLTELRHVAICLER